VFLEIRGGISKTERRFRICEGFFEKFRPAYVKGLGREYRLGRPLHKVTRRRIIDHYLTEEGPKKIFRAIRETPGAVYGINRHYETFGTCEAFSGMQGGRRYPSQLSDDVLESMELFKRLSTRSPIPVGDRVDSVDLTHAVAPAIGERLNSAGMTFIDSVLSFTANSLISRK